MSLIPLLDGPLPAFGKKESIIVKIRKLKEDFDKTQPGWISDHLILGHREHDELCAFLSIMTCQHIGAIGEFMGMKILRCGEGIKIASSSVVKWEYPLGSDNK